MQERHKKMLEPYSEQFGIIHSAVVNKTDNELEELAAACEAATTTNCWFGTYDAAQYVLRNIRIEQAVRSRVEKMTPVSANQR